MFGLKNSFAFEPALSRKDDEIVRFLFLSVILMRFFLSFHVIMIISRIVQICRKLFTCYPTCFTTALESYSSSTDLVLPDQWAVVVASVEISPISTGQEYKPVHLELVRVSDGNFIQVFSYQIGNQARSIDFFSTAKRTVTREVIESLHVTRRDVTAYA